MKKYILLLNVLITISCIAQQKNKWYDKYWAGANVSILFSSETNTNNSGISVGANVDVGKNLKNNYKLGVGYGHLQFDAITKINTLTIYSEKSFTSKKRALFFFAKPGIAFAVNKLELANALSWFEYYKSTPGFQLQVGSGIRWMINRHSYFISAGYNSTKYKIFSKEYPVAVDPYNPFVDEPIVHTLKLHHTKVMVNFGFTF
jgi:hypothetical protein